MRKILLYTPDPMNGVSFYRIWGPWSELHDQVSLTSFPNEAKQMRYWTWFKNYDCIIMNTFYEYNDWFFIQEAKKWGVPVWIDMDDALFHMPQDNHFYEILNDPQSRKYMTQCLQLADVVTVVSEIQKKYLELNLNLSNVQIIKNALDDRFVKYKKPLGNLKKVSWRGSETHLSELLWHSDPITQVMNEHPEKEFLFFGINPHFLTRKLKHPNFMYAKAIPIVDYIRAFTDYNAAFQFVPLFDSFFNRNKSPIAWIEGTLAGSVIMAPDFPEWELPGCEHYKPMDLNSFKFHLDKLMGKSENQLFNQNKESWQYIQDNLILNKINKTRMEILNNLCPRK